MMLPEDAAGPTTLAIGVPVPGQSLTREPGNRPFEQPPDIVDPVEALSKHLDHVSEADAFRDLSFFIEEGVTVQNMVQGILRSAVMSGIHNIDISLIIAPALHEYIVGML